MEFNVSEAAVNLLHLSRKLVEHIKIEGLETDLNKIQKFLAISEIGLETKKKISCKAQIVVFDEKTGNLLNMIPPKFDDTIRPLFLLASKQKGDTIVTGIIQNISNYFEKSQFLFFCFYCQKRFSGRGSTHKCRQRRSCFACHKYLLNPNTYVNTVFMNLFCTDEMVPKIKKFCPTCNVTLRNPLCETMHQKKVCRWGWLCPTCKKYTFKSKFLKTIKQIQETHSCQAKACKFCGKIFTNEKEHLCPLQKLQPPKYATKLAFLQMSFRGSSPASCLECLNTRKVCQFCANEDTFEQPNIAVLLMENKTGIFDSYTFADFDLFDYVSKENSVLMKRYFPENMELLQRSAGKATFFNQQQKVKIDKNTFCGLNVIDQIFQFILQKDFSNTTLLINAKQTNELSFFVDTLIQYGFKPKILKSENRIILVECSEMCLRILDAQNYVPYTHEEIALEQGENIHFFPKKLNKKTQYDYLGPCPSLASFFSFEDTPDDYIRKERFIKTFGNSPWEFRSQLKVHTKQKAVLTAISILNMVQACFQLQQSLSKSYEKSNKLVLHPINRPFLTYSGFIYQLFLSFCTEDLRIVRKPIEYQSSRGEVEFAQYLCSVLDPRTLLHAWSPYGQSKEFLPIAVPDIYDSFSKTVFFFNGCVIHNHDIQKCRFKRKATALNYNTQFENKLKKLALSPEVKNIRVLWQCHWQNQKTCNLKVKDFMSKIYTNPPPFRLDVRCSGNIYIK